MLLLTFVDKFVCVCFWCYCSPSLVGRSHPSLKSTIFGVVPDTAQVSGQERRVWTDGGACALGPLPLCPVALHPHGAGSGQANQQEQWMLARPSSVAQFVADLPLKGFTGVLPWELARRAVLWFLRASPFSLWFCLTEPPPCIFLHLRTFLLRSLACLLRGRLGELLQYHSTCTPLTPARTIRTKTPPALQPGPLPSFLFPDCSLLPSALGLCPCSSLCLACPFLPFVSSTPLQCLVLSSRSLPHLITPVTFFLTALIHLQVFTEHQLCSWHWSSCWGHHRGWTDQVLAPGQFTF